MYCTRNDCKIGCLLLSPPPHDGAVHLGTAGTCRSSHPLADAHVRHLAVQGLKCGCLLLLLPQVSPVASRLAWLPQAWPWTDMRRDFVFACRVNAISRVVCDHDAPCALSRSVQRHAGDVSWVCVHYVILHGLLLAVCACSICFRAVPRLIPSPRLYRVHLRILCCSVRAVAYCLSSFMA